MNDPNVKAIVIDVDSPGGTVSGVDELATEIYNARKQGTKKITAVSDCLCASAAYWIASQANEVVVSPTSLTGSIGVYQLHEDDSEMLSQVGVKVTLISAGPYKTEGNSYEPLGEEARVAMQGMVDDFYGMFTKAAARGRGVAVKAVTGGFGQGRLLTAQDAVKQGLADRIATLDEVLTKFGVKQSAGSSAALTPPAIAESGSALRADTVIDDDNVDDASDAECSCECEACVAGDCGACTHEGCDPEEEGCQGCGMASDASKKTGNPAAAATAARARRLRLARI
jgi:signal peptide peptidase SppA